MGRVAPRPRAARQIRQYSDTLSPSVNLRRDGAAIAPRPAIPTELVSDNLPIFHGNARLLKQFAYL